jgi:hypothetical protein
MNAVECRMCGRTDLELRTKDSSLKTHSTAPGLPMSEVWRCDGSGRTRAEVDQLLRQFDSWDDAPGSDVHRRTELIDNGDSISVRNTARVGRAMDLVADIDVRIDPSELPRYIEELQLMAAQRGLLPGGGL